MVRENYSHQIRCAVKLGWMKVGFEVSEKNEIVTSKKLSGVKCHKRFIFQKYNKLNCLHFKMRATDGKEGR
jgi:hypothetical protein